MTIAHKFMIPNGVSSQQANCYQVDGREFPEAVSCMKCYLWFFLKQINWKKKSKEFNEK